MVWLLAIVGIALVVGIAIAAVGRVSVELEGTMAPALLEIDDAIEVVAEALPFEVSAVVSHDDVHTIINWVLEFFEELGMSSDYGEELGGDWVLSERAVADEIGVVDHVVARCIETNSAIDTVHATVIADEFITYLRDIGAVGGEVA